MKRRVNVSLSLKLTLIVVILSIVIIFSLSTFNLYMENEKDKQFFYDTSYWAATNFSQSHAVIKTLDEDLTNYEKLNNTENLHEYLMDFIKNYSGILKINIIIPTPEGYMVNISTDNNAVGTFPNPKYNNLSYKNGDTYYIIDDKIHIITIISPINISGDIVGTHEITISSYPRSISRGSLIQSIVIISFISILILIFGLIFLLRRSIVNPIVKFRDSARVIGKGNLDTRIEIKSRDELGDLANAFNQMAKDLKESRDKVQDYTEILENLLDQKDEFIGQLGHDLKNPLQPLVGLLPMLIEEEKNPKTKETLELMNQNVEYMRNLIFDTLKLAKLRSSDIKLDFENLNLKHEVDHVIASQELNLKESKIRVESKIADDIIVNADKLRLAEVINNLISNAVKYTSEGRGIITIDAFKENQIVTVSVKDTGIGMTKNQLKKVFDEFFKAQKGVNELQSTGLGLSICKRIVEKHGGKIWADSDGPGKGSTIYFTLKSGDEK
jgi:signal transduction histidine kinase